MNALTKAGPFRVIAKGCETGRCPTVLESDNQNELVIVGKLDANVLNSLDVQKHTSEGEIAVVIPKKLLIEAFRCRNF